MNKKILKTLIISATFIILLGLNLEYKMSIDIGRLNNTFDIAETYKSERASITDASLKVISENPFGIGFMEQQDVIYKSSGLFKTPHNSFLAELVRGGLIVGTGFIILFLLPLRDLINKKKYDNKYLILLIGYLFYLIMSLAHAIFNWWVYWWLVYFILSFSVKTKRNEVSISS